MPSQATATGKNAMMQVPANPGPGEYEATFFNTDTKFVTKRVRGKSMKMRKAADAAHSVFKSTTGRHIEDDIAKVIKTQTAVVG